jgi:hypothetical protein
MDNLASNVLYPRPMEDKMTTQPAVLENELDAINRDLQTAIWEIGHTPHVMTDWERLDYEIKRFEFNLSKVREALLNATKKAIENLGLVEV